LLINFPILLKKALEKNFLNFWKSINQKQDQKRKKRLKEIASQKVKVEKKEEKQTNQKDKKKKQKKPKAKKPNVIKFGANHVTALVESNQAKLVLIAHDVDPLEIVMWLPALCRSKHVPYVIVKGKAQLGALVHQKQVACLAITTVNESDTADLAKIATYANENFNEAWTQMRTQWGGKKLSNKTIQRRKREESDKN